MQLTLPDAVESKLSPKDAALHLAIGLFVTEEATLGQAAEIAGLTQTAFLKELGRRRIPIHYGPQELAEDLRAVERRRQRELTAGRLRPPWRAHRHPGDPASY